MPVESAADRAVFVNPDEFGVTAGYALAGETETTDIDGIFTYPTREMFGGSFDNPGVEAGVPTFQCRFADLPEDALGGEGDILAVPGAWSDKKGERVFVADAEGAETARFAVRSIRPDGTGFAVLTLSEMEEEE